MRIQILLPFIILAITVSSLFSQPLNEEKLSVTLEKSIAMALDHNPSVKVA